MRIGILPKPQIIQCAFEADSVDTPYVAVVVVTMGWWWWWLNVFVLVKENIS